MPEGGGEAWGRGELLRQGGGKPDKGGKVDRFLGRMVRLVFRTIFRVVKLVLKGLWGLITPSKRERAKQAAKGGGKRAA
jgi:hypothetical protein